MAILHLGLTDDMKLDSFKLVEQILQGNRSSFAKERAVLPAKYRIKNGLLLYNNRLCVAAEGTLQTRLIKEAHEQVSTAHPSAEKTYKLLASKYYWKGMKATCQRYVRNCVCRRYHPRQIRAAGEIHPLLIPDRPMQHLSMDFKEFPRDKAGFN